MLHDSAATAAASLCADFRFMRAFLQVAAMAVGVQNETRRVNGGRSGQPSGSKIGGTGGAVNQNHDFRGRVNPVTQETVFSKGKIPSPVGHGLCVVVLIPVKQETVFSKGEIPSPVGHGLCVVVLTPSHRKQFFPKGKFRVL